MRLMMLYGVNCTKDVWNHIVPYFKNFEIDYVEYPHEITSTAKKVDDITEWVYKNYNQHHYDAIIGHSLGGIIAILVVYILVSLIMHFALRKTRNENIIDAIKDENI